MPLAASTLSRMPCRPDISASSSALNGSSMPLRAKSKLSASESSDSASISSGSFSISAHLSSASALVAAATVLTRCVILTCFGIAAEARHVGLEPGIVALAGLDARIDDEDHLAPARAESLAAAARTGLDDDRMALRRARHRERPARAEIAAFVIEAVNFLGPCKKSGRLVLDDGVVLPGVPMAEHDLHELVGAVVAQIVGHRLVAAHVLRLAVVERGDDVPGGAAARHQIESGEHARHMKRLVIAGGISGAEPEPLRRHAHHGEHGDGVELHAANAMFDSMRVIAAIHVRHRQPVVEEAEMKLSFFQHAADVPVKIRRPGIGARGWMAPGAGEVGAVLRLQEADQDHLAHRRGPSREGRCIMTRPRARSHCPSA